MPETEHDKHVKVNSFSTDLDDGSPHGAGDSSGPRIDLSSMPIEDAVQVVFAAISEDARDDVNDLLEEMNETRKRRKAIREAMKKMGAAAGLLGLLLLGSGLFMDANLARSLGVGSAETGWSCPSQIGDAAAGENQLPAVQNLVKGLSDLRVLVGSEPLCNLPASVGGDQPGGGSAGGQPSGGQPGGATGADSSGCGCVGVDTICKNADGSIQSASYNATECGGSGKCECRDPNKTLTCPDGTYADFNPQCGVGGTTGGSSSVCGNQLCEAGEDPNNCLADCPLKP